MMNDLTHSLSSCPTALRCCFSCVFPLQKPQSEFTREGPKGLVRMGAPLRRGDAFYCESVVALSGRRYVLWGSAVAAPLAEEGGRGGYVTHRLPAEGCQAREPHPGAPATLLLPRAKVTASRHPSCARSTAQIIRIV